MTAVALVGATVFDGSRFRQDSAVVIERGRIKAVGAAEKLPARIGRHQLKGLLVPGFIDVQVNGGGGVLFNDMPSVDGIRAIGAAHRRFGTTGFLPTLITDTREKMAAAVEAVRLGMKEKVPGLLGIHLEGPFLNPARKGVHDARFMRPIEAADVDIMTSLDAGRTVVTLAPEMVPAEAVARLAEAGVIVSAGHAVANIATMEEAVRSGLSGVTHLFNAMPPLTAREPGMIGAALTMPEIWAGIIVDGIHVAPATLRAAFAAKADRLLLVTDAMPLVGSEETRFLLQGREITLKDRRLTSADGTLAGAHLDMAAAVRNTVRLGVPLERALRMASAQPAAFLGLDAELGRIARGCRANLALLDDDLTVRATWIDGDPG